MPAIVGSIGSSGLLVDVTVGVSHPRRSLLWRQNMTLPPPVGATFIVDTGADTTTINDQLMRSLGLIPTSNTYVMTAQSAGIPQLCDVYDVQLTIIGHSGLAWTIDPVAVIGRPLLNQSTDGMIGRDVLDLATLTYDGPSKQFSINY